MQRKYTWRRDNPDRRDYRLPVASGAVLPSAVDLRAGFPKQHLDQLQEGACVEGMLASTILFDQGVQGRTLTMPSRQFCYYNARYLEGTVASDAGSTIRDGFRSLSYWGWVPELVYPYITPSMTDAQVLAALTRFPGSSLYPLAAPNRIANYARVAQTLTGIKSALAVSKRPVGCGFTVYASWDDVGTDGLLPDPAPGEAVLGGHATLIVGMNDTTGLATCRNDYGDAWGAAGDFFVRYDYLLSADWADFWVLNALP